jgi:hypothetical protein
VCSSDLRRRVVGCGLRVPARGSLWAAGHHLKTYLRRPCAGKDLTRSGEEPCSVQRLSLYAIEDVPRAVPASMRGLPVRSRIAAESLRRVSPSRGRRPLARFSESSERSMPPWPTCCRLRLGLSHRSQRDLRTGARGFAARRSERWSSVRRSQESLHHSGVELRAAAADQFA